MSTDLKRPFARQKGKGYFFGNANWSVYHRKKGFGIFLEAVLHIQKTKKTAALFLKTHIRL
jgi:hypothetical protein